MQKLTLKDLVKDLRNLEGKTAISFHSMGDVDAMASAFALSSAVHNSEVRRIDTVNSQARKVWGRLNLNLEPFEMGDLQAFDNLIFVDVSTPHLLGNLKPNVERYKGNLIAIDHHSHNSPFHGKLYIDVLKTSCSEVVFEILREMKHKFSEQTATLLAAGIISDTAYFKSANASAINVLGECLSASRKELQEIYDLIYVKEDISEKIAVVDAVKRAQLEHIKDNLIAASQVSAFELRCAAALVDFGCDFAVVANQKEAKLSAIKGRAFELRRLNVGKLLDEVGRSMKGSGGGHEMVGGANFVHGLDALIAAEKIMAHVRFELDQS